MCRLIETIKLQDGLFHNLYLHMARMNRSRSELWNENKTVDLSLTLSELNIPHEGLWRCRITYARQIEEISLSPYNIKKISSLKIMRDDILDYAYKYEDRSGLQKLLEYKGIADDILIVQQGLVTDCSYANLIFLKNQQWYTPSRPLLKGTKREKLLGERKILEMEIHEKDLGLYEKAGLINAFLDPGMIEFPIDHIL